MPTPIHIGLVEDQLLFREGMKAILHSWPDLSVVLEASEGHGIIQRLQDCDPKPDVLLVDLSLPAVNGVECSGVEVTQAVRSHFPDIKILILSVHDEERFIAELIEQGAHGYLVKDSDPNEVYEAIRAVYEKGSYVNQRTLLAIQRQLNEARHKPKAPKPTEVPLTRREIEVLQLVCEQLTAEEIAERLFISVKTVNGHRNNLLQKTGSRNMAGLVMYALKKGIVITK